MKLIHRRRVTAAGILAALVLVLVCSCARPVSADTPAKRHLTNIVAGVVPDETDTAMFVAQEHGFFAAHGLHVTIKTIVSTEDAVPQLVDGSLDVAAGQLPTWLSAQARGLGPFRILAPGVELTPNVDELVALSTSQITNAGQLAGKVIAVNASAGNGPLLTDNTLGEYFIAPSSVTYKVASFPDTAAALASHEVDAAYCTEPWCTEMAEKLGAVPIADLSQGNAEGMMIGGYTVTAAWLKKNPRTAAEFSAAIHEAINLAGSNLAVVWKAFEAGLHVPSQLAPLLKIGNFPHTVTPNAILQIADLMVAYGELSPATNVRALATALADGK